MTIQQYELAGPVIGKIQEAKSELGRLNEVISEADGTLKVKISQRWTIELPHQALKALVQQRKNKVEAEIAELEAELAKI